MGLFGKALLFFILFVVVHSQSSRRWVYGYGHNGNGEGSIPPAGFADGPTNIVSVAAGSSPTRPRQPGGFPDRPVLAGLLFRLAASSPG